MADIFEKLVKNYGPLGKHRERAHGYFTLIRLRIFCTIILLVQSLKVKLAAE